MKYLNILPLAAFAIPSSAAPDSPPGGVSNGEPNKLAARDGVECGPGNGVWVMGQTYLRLVDEFCLAAEGSDLSDGYMAHDTYLVRLTPQGSQTIGDEGKIIFTIRNEGQRPAFHVRDWMLDCADPLRVLINGDCQGDRGDTPGGSNKIGSIKFEAVIKKGDVW